MGKEWNCHHAFIKIKVKYVNELFILQLVSVVLNTRSKVRDNFQTYTQIFTEDFIDGDQTVCISPTY